CQTSQVVRATLFTPSSTKSIAVSFSGQGANGAPTFMPSSDITGVHLQAYWNNATNNPATGSTGDSTTLADALTDSDGNASTITFEFASNGAWGAGTASGTIGDSPTDRMLNGLVGTANPGATTPST